MRKEVKLFKLAWQDVESRGGCDAPGGGEYHRILGEWVAADCPSLVREFIAARANKLPEKPREETNDGNAT